MATTKIKTANSAKRKASARTPRITDVVRLGAQTAGIKANTAPDQWKKIVKAAHGQGYTVESALSDVPAALKARTKASLQAQATKTVQQAYQPQAAELDYAAKQAAGLREKRLSDEGAFNSWYQQQVSATNATAAKAQQDYQDAATTQATKVQTDADTNQAALKAQVQQGASGDMSNSIYLKSAQDLQTARKDAAGRTAVAAVGSGTSAALAANARSAGVVGQHQADVAGIESDYGKVISDVTAGRLKLASSQAADQIKAYTDLLNGETSKANAVQQYSGLMAQLSQKQDAQQIQNQQYYAGLGQKAAQSKLNAKVSAGNSKRAANTALSVAQLNAQQKQMDRDLKANEGALSRANALAIAKAHNPGSATQPSQSAIDYSIQQVNIIHTLKDLISKYGSKYTDKNGHPQDMRTALISRGYSSSQIDGGLSLARYGRIKNPSLYKQLGILAAQRG